MINGGGAINAAENCVAMGAGDARTGAQVGEGVVLHWKTRMFLRKSRI